MGIRLHIGLFLLKFSYYLRRIFVVVLTPRDLIEYNKLQYRRKCIINRFAGPDFNLTDEEREILENHIKKPGKFLVLGCGGGRESIALARLGFDVVGVDFLEEMVNSARKNAASNNLSIEFRLEDMTSLCDLSSTFDYAGLFYGIYGTIPSRNLRIGFLRQIKRVLKPGGFFIFNFFIKNNFISTYRSRALKTIGWFTLGNREYQPGDELSDGDEFMHFFCDKAEAEREIKDSGFEIEAVNSRGNSGLTYVIAKS